MKSILAILFSVLTLVACSVTKSTSSHTETCVLNGRQVDCSQMPGAGGQQKPIPDPIESKPVTFYCGVQACRSDQHYCLKLTDTPTQRTYEGCMEKATSCTTCDCVVPDAQQRAPDFCTKNRMCEQLANITSTKLTLTCWN